MKIKTWLLMTYLLVMIFPLLAVYVLYISINAYYNDQNVEEYLKKWNEITDLKPLLNDATLYSGQANFSTLEGLDSEQQMIRLYKANGNIIYESSPFTFYSGSVKRDTLYKGLYEFVQSYRTFSYKEPVYEQGKIIGVYEITLARTEWTEQVQGKTMAMLVSILAVLIVLYGGVMYFLNRRFHNPMNQLIEQMQTFAKGQATKILPAKKDELGALTKSFQAMQAEIILTRQRLEEEQRQKNFMIASLSHDLKTPLTSIQAYTEGLLAGKLTKAEQQEYLSIISAKSVYMKQLVEDLMMFSLLQSTSYEIELVLVEGEEFFEMLLQDYEQVSIEKGFHASTEVAVRGTYLVNPKQLMRVMDNIVSNAWTYTPKEGMIRIAAFEAAQMPAWCKPYVEGQDMYIIVENDGSSLTVEDCTQMFEPMSQIDEARSTNGAGLGLAISKQIIERHSGTIHAVSLENKVAIIIGLPLQGGN